MAVSSLAVRPGIIAVFLLLGGCGEDGLSSAPQRPPPPFEEVREEVSRLRGLPFLHEVAIERKKLREMRSLVTDSDEETNADTLSARVEIYRRLGLSSESPHLSEELLDLQLFRKSVDYDPRTRKIIVPEEPVGPGLAFLRSPWQTDGETTRQMLLVHALTHALQEQNFHWRARIQSRSSRDWELTLRAVMHGDAALVGLAYLAGDGERKGEKIVEGVKSLFRLSALIERELSRLPDALRQELAFEYLYGSQFVLWAYAHKAWQGVNALFARPPVSSAQILHPDKYYVSWEEPLQIIPWRLLRLFGADKIAEETLGEFTIRVLLAQSVARSEAENTAAGWRGDTLVLFRQREESFFGWITAWASPIAAREFFTAYRRVLERRHGIALEPGAGGDVLASREGSHPLLLQTKDNFVFVLDGLEAPRSAEVATGLWAELETTREPRKIPFDVVRGSQGRSSVGK